LTRSACPGETGERWQLFRFVTEGEGRAIAPFLFAPQISARPILHSANH
jgi:hypothetical protein